MVYQLTKGFQPSRRQWRKRKLPKPGFVSSFRYGPEDEEDVKFVCSLYGNVSKGIMKLIRECARRERVIAENNPLGVKYGTESSKPSLDKVKILLETSSMEWNELLAKHSAEDNSRVQVATWSINQQARNHWNKKNLQPKPKKVAIEPVVDVSAATTTGDNGEEVVGDDGEVVL